MDLIEPRDFTGAYTMPTDPQKRRKFATNLVQPYKLVMLTGFSGTGKTTFSNCIQPKHNWTLSRWSRDQVMDPLFPDRNRIDKFYNYLSQMESKMIPSLLDQDWRQTVVEGWYRTQRSRSRILKYAQDAGAKVGIFVFDGPVDKIVERCQKSERFMQQGFELEEYVEQKMATHVWPKFNEGEFDIIYINTFGQAGVKHFEERLI